MEKPVITAVEYLALERAAATKSEFCDCEIFAMAGTSKNRARIVMNFSRELSNALKGRKCEPFANNLRLKVEARGLYTYPDLLVVCEDVQFEQFLRTSDADWLYRVTDDPGESVQFPSIDCRLALAEIYDRVEFPTGLAIPPDPRERAA